MSLFNQVKALLSFTPMFKPSPNQNYDFSLKSFQSFRSLAVASYSELFVAITKSHPITQYAIRKIKKKIFDSKTQPQFSDHIDQLYAATHQNVIKLIYHFEDRKYLYLVFEYADQANLQTQLLSTKKLMEEDDVLDVIHTIAKTLKYLHEKKIIYRNLNLSRILVVEDQIKLGEIGLDEQLKSKLRHSKTNRNIFKHQPPELFLNAPITPQIDIWQLGIVFHQLLTTKSPFQIDDTNIYIKSEKEKYQFIQANILKDIFYLDRNIAKPIRDLIKQMLQHVPSNRISIDDIVNHSVFTESIRRYSIDTPSPLFLSNQFSFLLSNNDQPRTNQSIFSQILPTDNKEVEVEEVDYEIKTPPQRPSVKEQLQNIKKESVYINLSILEDETIYKREEDEEMEVRHKRKDSEKIQLGFKICNFSTKTQDNTPNRAHVRKASKYEALMFQKHRMTRNHKLNYDVIDLNQQLEELKHKFRIMSNENLIIQKQIQTISAPSPFTPSTPSTPLSNAQVFTINSGISYQNFRDQSSVDYFNILFHKLREIKNDRFCLKQQIVNQQKEIESMNEEYERVYDLERELAELQNTKRQYVQVSQKLREQINEIQENRNYMYFQSLQVTSENMIANFLKSLEQKYAQVQLNEEELNEFYDHICVTEIYMQGRNFFKSSVFEPSPLLQNSLSQQDEVSFAQQQLVCDEIIELGKSHCFDMLDQAKKTQISGQKQKNQKLIANYESTLKEINQRKKQLMEENEKMRQESEKPKDYDGWMNKLKGEIEQKNKLVLSASQYQNELSISYQVLCEKVGWIEQSVGKLFFKRTE